MTGKVIKKLHLRLRRQNSFWEKILIPYHSVWQRGCHARFSRGRYILCTIIEWRSRDYVQNIVLPPVEKKRQNFLRTGARKAALCDVAPGWTVQATIMRQMNLNLPRQSFKWNVLSKIPYVTQKHVQGYLNTFSMFKYSDKLCRLRYVRKYDTWWVDRVCSGGSWHIFPTLHGKSHQQTELAEFHTVANLSDE